MTSQVADRRSLILAVSAELFADRGVVATTVREIADRAGVRAGALYYHFPSKDAIVRELIEEYLRGLRAEYASRASRELDPQTRLRAIVEISLHTADKQPHATQVYQSELPNLRDRVEYRQARLLADDVQRVWLETLEDGQAAGVFREDVPAKVFHRFLRDAVWLSIKWRHPDDPYTSEELLQDCMVIFLDGFAVRRRRLRGSIPSRG